MLAVKDPGAPTAKEVAEHEITHLPHRSWCAACVSGRSRDRSHRRLHHREQSSVPTIVFDYGFMGGKDDAETASILVARDVDTKMLFAHVVPRKGLVSDHGVEQLLKDIERLGYQKLCVKSDGEPALLAIQHEIVKRRQAETLLENCPAGDSQANGIAERAVQSIAQQVRVLRHSLQQKLGAVVPGTHAVTCWLVEHAADLLNKYQLGEDGRTAYHRLRGKCWQHELVEFGEKVHYKVNVKNLSREQKLEPRWEEGFFMGVKWRTGESWIGTSAGIVKTSAIRRVGGHRRWDAEGLLGIKGVPWDHVQADVPIGEPHVTWLTPDQLPKPVVPSDGEPRRRRVYLQKQDFHKYGFTSDCPGCKAIINGGESRPHTETCRSRMEESLKTSDEGKVKMSRAKERLDEQMARIVERNVLQQEENTAKRARVSEASSSHQSPASMPESSSPPDVHMSEQNKRVVGPENESATKKLRSQSDSMEVSYCERMMQEDFSWSLHNVSDMCEGDSAAVQQGIADMTYLD